MLKATQKLIHKLLDHPKYTLSFLAMITLILGSYLPGLKMDFTIEQLFSQDDPVIDRFMTFREEFAGVDNVIFLIYESDDPFSHNNLIKNKALTERLEEIEGVESATSLTNIELFTEGGDYLLQPVYDEIPISTDSLLSAKNRIMSSELVKNYIISEDGKVAAILVEVDRDYNEHKGRERILKEIDQNQSGVDWEWHQAGLPVIRTRYVQYMIADNIKFLCPVLFMLIILLFFLFRSWIGLLLPLTVVGLTIIWTIGIMTAFGVTVNIISYMIPTLLMIIGISDSVHFLVKYFHTLKAVGHRREALFQTVKKIGTAILLTSLTTAIGFGALSFVNIEIVKEFGIFTAIGVLFAFIITVLFIPSMLMILERTPESKLDAYSKGFRMRIINKIILFVRAYPKRIIYVGLLICVIGIFGAVQMNPHSKLLEDLRPGNQLLDDMHFSEERMGAVLPVEVIIQIDEVGPYEDIQDVEVLTFMDELSQYLSTIPEVGKVISVSDYMKEIHRAMNDGDPSFYKIPESRNMISQYMLLYESEFESLMNVDYTKLRIAVQIKDIDSRRSAEMEKEINEFILSVVPNGLTVEVTGTAFLALRTNNYLVYNLAGSFLIAFGVITLLMVFLFRSVKMALISILPNIIPMMIMAAVLGFFQIPLRPSTAMTFAIAFGIAVDDTLHYLTRYRMELSEADCHYRQANDATLMSTGIAMMSTTAILVSGFLVLLVSEFTPTIQFGALSAITILSALVGDLTFLPALLSQVKPRIKGIKD
ncbi:MAG: RND family transporter [Candidatus Marinimicrobia bacterium]|jgi:hypothetical protein|nr:RND family transporter [Candidatus Neomarinimicrobiota bacterium]MBT3675962.1 RND family transporter [Candidatus Neomarinimicrobiota bacterium]MBT3762467.1 RND family transporter [Candidatus Neomarinimicrobiota bacterium]MBT4068043.1 RND family transporter [Candidatus Neomarinimicrobiota bacterium]MBT4270214.1 RND family transporter [Candidatus Neomarinimicrobiota bacterium]